MKTARTMLRTESCKGCGLCVPVCPERILAMDEMGTNRRGYHPVIQTDRRACTDCGSCIVICPVAAFSFA